VRELLGVQLIEGIRDARIVTTSEFTDPAKKAAAAARTSGCAFNLELVDADRLLTLLRVYKSNMPSLNDIARREGNREMKAQIKGLETDG
jgi:hypothetical protein